MPIISPRGSADDKGPIVGQLTDVAGSEWRDIRDVTTLLENRRRSFEINLTNIL